MFLQKQLTAGPVAFQSRVSFGESSDLAGFRLSLVACHNRAEILHYRGAVWDSIIRRTVEFDVFMHNYEAIDGGTKGVAHRPLPGLQSPRTRADRAVFERPGSLRSTITPCVGTGGTTFRPKPAPPTLRAGTRLHAP